jgi:hypothetical protein
MKDILLKNATLSEIEERLDRLDEVIVSSATTDQLITFFDFTSMDEKDRINLIYKILNPFESRFQELTFLEEQEIINKFNLK